MYTILLYKGKNSQHAKLRSILRSRPWREWKGDDWYEFLEFYYMVSKDRFVFPRGETPEDENWMIDQIGNNLSQGDGGSE